MPVNRCIQQWLCNDCSSVFSQKIHLCLRLCGHVAATSEMRKWRLIRCETLLKGLAFTTLENYHSNSHFILRLDNGGVNCRMRRRNVPLHVIDRPKRGVVAEVKPDSSCSEQSCDLCEERTQTAKSGSSLCWCSVTDRNENAAFIWQSALVRLVWTGS